MGAERPAMAGLGGGGAAPPPRKKPSRRRRSSGAKKRPLDNGGDPAVERVGGLSAEFTDLEPLTDDADGGIPH
jgi:hypothetical protein